MQAWTVFEVKWSFARDLTGRQVRTRIGLAYGSSHASAKADATGRWPGKWIRLEQCSGPPAPAR